MLDLVADPLSADLDGLYEFLGVVFQMNLDIDRIRAVHPEVRTILQSAGWSSVVDCPRPPPYCVRIAPRARMMHHVWLGGREGSDDRQRPQPGNSS
ncbi:MAG: hypothetical protein VX427_15965 [Acidobacteriota bacterium]|nr:hypothetical protein [Acidobacteriota bacterium]